MAMERYELVRELGRGAMGVVYQALQVELGRNVALKLMHPAVSRDPEFAGRFERESRTLASLVHPGVVRVFDVGVLDGQLFYAMELLEGCDLWSVVHERGSLPLGQLVAVAAQVAEALAFLHEHGLTHRDVKPSNLFLEKGGRVVLTDFGLVADPRAPALTQVGELLGTPRFMSPEAVVGEGGPAQDVWALAVSLHELYTGRASRTEVEALAVVHQVRDEPAPDLATAGLDVPAWLLAVQRHALARDPRQRATAKDVQRVFEARRDREALEAMAALSTKLSLERYQVGRKLGEGGMGAVYRATDRELKRVVAMKVISTQLTEDALRRFQREMKLLARLSHPNVIRVFDSGKNAAGQAYFAMELIDGEDLERMYRRQGRVPFARAVDLLVQASEGLAHVHAQGLLHRDIKPANLMVEKSGRLVVMDFGLVKDPNATVLTQDGGTVGTLRYLPPEVLLGREHTPGADVWALALTAHELLTGSMLYPTLSMNQLIQQIVNHPPPDLGREAPETPRWFQELQLRALAKDPAQRLTAAQYLEALRRGGRPDEAADALEGDAAPAGAPGRGRRRSTAPVRSSGTVEAPLPGAGPLGRHTGRVAVTVLALGILGFALRWAPGRRGPAPEVAGSPVVVDSAKFESSGARFAPPRRLVVELGAAVAPGTRVMCAGLTREVPDPPPAELAFENLPAGAEVTVRFVGPDGSERAPPRTLRAPLPVRVGNLACHPTEEGVTVDFDLAAPTRLAVAIYRPGQARPVLEVTREPGPRWFHHHFTGLQPRTGYVVRATDSSGWAALVDYPFDTRGPEHLRGLESILPTVDGRPDMGIYDLDLLRGAPDDRAIPHLVRRLRGMTPAEFGDARRLLSAIAPIRSEELSGILFDIFRSGGVSQGVSELFHAAASGRHPALLAAATELLADPRAKSGRQALLHCVADRGGRDGVERMADVIERDSDSEDERTPYAFVRCDPEAARAHLERWVRQTAPPSPLFRLGLDGLGVLGDAAAAAVLAELVAKPPSPAVRALAALQLARIPENAGRLALAASLRAEPGAPDLAWAAALAGAPDVAGLLAARLARPGSEAAREDAAYALGTLGTAGGGPATTALRTALEDPSARVAGAAAWALAQLPEPDAAGALERLALSARDTCGLAALALARLKDRSAAPRLAALLTELVSGAASRPPSALEWLRMGAMASALAELGDPVATSVLHALDAVRGAPRAVHELAQNSLKRLTRIGAAEAEMPLLVVPQVTGIRAGFTLHPGESVEVSGNGLMLFTDRPEPLSAELNQTGPGGARFGMRADLGATTLRIGRNHNRLVAEQPVVMVLSAYDRLDDPGLLRRDAAAGFAWVTVRR